MVWLIAAPFLSALALAAVIVTISSPLYHWLEPRVYKKSKSLAAFVATLAVFLIGILPIALVTGLIVGEVADFYQKVDQTGEITLGGAVTMVESKVSAIIPGFEINLSGQIQLVAEWFTGNLTNIFTETLSLFFLFFIALLASFYFFRDGRELLQVIIKASPLPDNEDQEILDRLGRAVRGVFTGSLLVALIQAILATLGMLVTGVENAILIGCIVAIAAMIPGVGTGLIMVPVSFILIFGGSPVAGAVLLIWSLSAVGFVDNLIGPQLMSRGNNLHPFIILISVLGGLSLFGLIGYLVGPVVVTLFVVLLEIYNHYIVPDQPIDDLKNVHDEERTN